MSEQPRDWDREMADIDRVIAKQGSVPPGGPAPAVPAGRPAVPAAPVGMAPVRRRSVALTWFWVALAVTLSVALAIWPYRRECGLQLFFYLGAAGVTVVVGVVAALASWSHRRGFAHILALATLAWSAVAVVREVLPRIGYAKVDRTWTCVASPSTGVTAGQGTSAPAPSAGQAQPAPSGAVPSGTPPSGTAPPGNAPSGTSPGGTSPGGTSPGGTSPGGTSPSGSAPSSSGPPLQSTTVPSEAPTSAPSGGTAGPAAQP